MIIGAVMDLKPYYQTDLGVLYHGDCLDILPLLDSVDLLLTDPPYIGLKGGLKHKINNGVCKVNEASITIGDIWNADNRWFEYAWEKTNFGAIVFCSYHNVDIIKTDNSIALCTWYKRNTVPSLRNVPRHSVEFFWAYKKTNDLNWRRLKTFYDIPNLVAGCMATERILDGSKSAHPCQKPIALFSAILEIGGHTVLDPFIGTGTTAISCERLNRQWIGIEISERYCEIAAKRIEKERAQLKLFPKFEPEQPKIKQASIF